MSKSTQRDELLDLHGPLLADVLEQDDYTVSAVTSISAYSEGVEHALETVWAKGYRKPQVVPKSAVDASAKKIWELWGVRHDPEYIRAILQAATPYIKAEAWDECEAASYEIRLDPIRNAWEPVKDNPYRTNGEK